MRRIGALQSFLELLNDAAALHRFVQFLAPALGNTAERVNGCVFLINTPGQVTLILIIQANLIRIKPVARVNARRGQGLALSFSEFCAFPFGGAYVAQRHGQGLGAQVFLTLANPQQRIIVGWIYSCHERAVLNRVPAGASLGPEGLGHHCIDLVVGAGLKKPLLKKFP